jgi:hypothetical protein
VQSERIAEHTARCTFVLHTPYVCPLSTLLVSAESWGTADAGSVCYGVQDWGGRGRVGDRQLCDLQLEMGWA